MEDPKKALLTDENVDPEDGMETLFSSNISQRSVCSIDIKECSLSFRNIDISVGEKKILKDLSGDISPGRMTCILGASGAGKTTLLNYLSGRIQSSGAYTISGDVFANGHKINPREFRKNVAYVMQEDHILGTATVREAIDFSARLRTPYSEKKRKVLVDQILEQLKLTKCEDTYIGTSLLRGVSGGEKKRTSVAIELITKPNLLFLDEPTSGLDSYSAFVVTKILKNLNDTGCSVVATLHQPSSEIFYLFDDVIILHEGEFVYSGPVANLKSYFKELGKPAPENFSLCDHAIFTVQQSEDLELVQMVEHWKTKRFLSEIKEEDPVENESYRKSFCTQLAIVSQREFRDITRDWPPIVFGTCLTAFMGLLVSFCFYQVGTEHEPSLDNLKSRTGAALQIAISAMFGSAQPVLLTFQFRRPVFIREYSSGQYGVVPYFLSKFVAEIPKTLLLSIVQFLVAYWIMALNGRIYVFVLYSFLLSMASSSLALLIGCIMPSVETAIAVSPLIFVPQILFSGLFIGIDKIPEFLRWINWVCSLKYGLSLILIEEFEKENVAWRAGIEASFNLKFDDWANYIYVLIGLIIGFRIIAALILKMKASAV